MVSLKGYFILYRLQFQLAVSVKLQMSVMNQIQVRHSRKMTKARTKVWPGKVTMTRYRCVSMTNVFSFMKLFDFPCKVSEVEVKHVSSHPMCPTVLKVGKMISKCPQFSQSTMAVLASGQMTKSARTEIVQATASKMLNFCKYPTTPQHEVIRKKIVADILHGRKDTTESGYVSHQCVGKCSLCSLTDCRAHGEQL